MENKILNSLAMVMTGVIASKLIRGIIKYNEQKNEHAEIMDDADED